MRDYLAGQVYPFEVTDIREVNERKFIYLSDGYKDTFRVLPYDYQLEWEPYNLPSILNCFVVSVNEFGLPLLAQVRKEVLAHNYIEEGTEYAFKLVAKRKDLNTSAEFYELHDAFGLSHRYYPKPEEPPREISDIFSLVVKGIEEKENNRAFLKLAPVEEVRTHAVSAKEDISEGLSIGSEGEFTEFKSTIVFPAGSIQPDIDRQIMIICKTLAGFMNKAGGELYIGVNDTGMVSGISQDFPYLNSSKVDTYTYPSNNDGYENKIRTAVKNLLGNTANANIGVAFETQDNLIYCKIQINEVLKPIFLTQSKLYQRAGNMTQLLKGEEISWFIEERYRRRSSQEGNIISPVKLNLASIEETEEEVLITAPEEENLIPISYSPNDEEKIWYWMSFYKNGSWSFDTKPESAEDKVYELGIPASLKNERMIMAYKNGCVNVVIPYDHIKPKGKNGRRLRHRKQRYSNGWNTGSEILKFLCVDRRDLLVFQSKMNDGSEWVKIHNVSAISLHSTLHLAGNTLINAKLEASIESVDSLSLSHYHFVSALLLKDHQTSGYLGFRRKDKSLGKVYRVLDQLLKKES